LEAVTRPRWRLLAPQLIDQLVDGHHATAHRRQPRTGAVSWVVGARRGPTA
jgi:hypothetical protein